MGRLFHRYEPPNHRGVVSGASARDNQGARRHTARNRDGSRYDAVRESAPACQRMHADGDRVDRREERGQVVCFCTLGTLSYRIRIRRCVASGISTNNLERIMQRRTFPWGTPGSILAIGLAVSGCTTTGTSDASGHQTDKRHTIDAGVDSTLARVYR